MTFTKNTVQWVLLILVGLGFVGGNIGCKPVTPKPAPIAEPTDGLNERVAQKTVKLVIDYGDCSQRVYLSLAWNDGDTVLSAMDKAKVHTHPLAFAYTGSEASVFVTEIDGMKNQGGGADKKNWLFWVNGKFGDRSAGVYPVQAADEIVWKFSLWPAQ